MEKRKQHSPSPRSYVGRGNLFWSLATSLEPEAGSKSLGVFCAHFLCRRRRVVQAPMSKTNGFNLLKMMYATIEAISSVGCNRHLFLFTRTRLMHRGDPASLSSIQPGQYGGHHFRPPLSVRCFTFLQTMERCCKSSLRIRPLGKGAPECALAGAVLL
jgi:hypothetical protein